MKKVIIGTSLVKYFGLGEEKTKVLDEVSIEIMQGEFTAVMGPSGCGKSTLLFALSGMDGISSGSVKFGENDISSLSENELADLRRRRMGFVFQQPTMIKNLNLLDNLILPSIQEDRKNLDAINQKAKKLMKETGISGLEGRDITQVSGGQLQRAGICRALMNTPDIIFADEPTGALNSKSADEIMELFSKINEEGTAVLLVTHDAKVAARAGRVLFMKDGKIASELRFDKFSKNNWETRTEQIVKQMTCIEI